MSKIISFDIRKTMTKKDYLELQKANRITNGFNTGERMFKNKKHPARNSRKKDFEKELNNFINNS